MEVAGTFRVGKPQRLILDDLERDLAAAGAEARRWSCSACGAPGQYSGSLCWTCHQSGEHEPERSVMSGPRWAQALA